MSSGCGGNVIKNLTLIATKDGTLVFHFEMFTTYQLLKLTEIEKTNLFISYYSIFLSAIITGFE